MQHAVIQPRNLIKQGAVTTLAKPHLLRNAQTSTKDLMHQAGQRLYCAFTAALDFHSEKSKKTPPSTWEGAFPTREVGHGSITPSSVLTSLQHGCTHPNSTLFINQHLEELPLISMQTQ